MKIVKKISIGTLIALILTSFILICLLDYKVIDEALLMKINNPLNVCKIVATIIIIICEEWDGEFHE